MSQVMALLRPHRPGLRSPHSRPQRTYGLTSGAVGRNSMLRMFVGNLDPVRLYDSRQFDPCPLFSSSFGTPALSRRLLLPQAGERNDRSPAAHDGVAFFIMSTA